MSNQQAEMKQIRRLIGIWMNEIRLNNYENYTDINKVGEHLSRQLLNKIYGFQLEDLNRIQANFPGLDIGDQARDLIAYQVTSRTDRRKIIEGLETVVKNGYDKTFTNGIRFLILNDTDTVKFGPKARKTPGKILPTFKLQSDVLYPLDLIKAIEDIYEKEGDLIKFNVVKAFLEKELIPIASGKPASLAQSETEKLQKLLTESIEKLGKTEDSEIKVSASFFYGDLKVPPVAVISSREDLVTETFQNLTTHDLVWLQGAPSSGKTSLAVLLSKKAEDATLWIECRDIHHQQLLEHILTLLTHNLGVPFGKNYEGTLSMIGNAIEAGSVLILNDLPDLQDNVLLQQQLASLITHLASNNVGVFATSNHPISSHLESQLHPKVKTIAVPALVEKDTTAVLVHFGASDETASLWTGLVTKTTEGHPLLVQSAARFLSQKNWSVDEETVKAIFTGRFGDASERESYARVLTHTADEQTRELLYRLRHVVGSFDLDILKLISAVSPGISHPAEKMSLVKDIWVQDLGNGKYQLSPLVKSLDGNVRPDVEKEVNYQLATAIIDKKNISQVDAFAAIYYFSKAEQFNRAAIILFRVLTEFVQQPELFFDWNFDLFWWNTKLPQDVASLFKVQIRIQQIIIGQSQKRDTSFLINDLREIVVHEDVGLLGKASSNMFFFQTEMVANPISALRYLADAQTGFLDLQQSDPSFNLMKEEILNGIWFIFSQIHTKQEYDEWFRIYQTLTVAAPIVDPEKNSFFVMAGVSIYRNVVLKSESTGADVQELLRSITKTAIDSKLYLLAAYAVKYLIKYLVEVKKDFSAALEIEENSKDLKAEGPIYNFLILSELAARYFYAGNIDAATYYFGEVTDTDIPTNLYSEMLDYLIGYMQVAAKNDPTLAAQLVEKALKTALQGPQYVLEDKVKLYGEAAIIKVSNKQYAEALDLYEQGYLLLLQDFRNTEEQQALIIRYGNALKYLIELIEEGTAKSYGGNNGFVIPETGYFYRTNEKLLEGGFYFDERKFMVANMLQSGFESLTDLDRAKYWAYKGFELSLDVENGRFVPILQLNTFYLVQDGQIKQAYNVQASIDSFYEKLKEKQQKGEPMEEGLKSLLEKIKTDDLGVYFNILLPVAMSFSLDVLDKNTPSDQYQMMIDDAFDTGKYLIKDSVAFAFAKQLFEKIMIDRISYQEMQEFFNSYQGEFKDILYIVGCLLLTSFTGAVESAQLHLAIIQTLDKVARQMKSMYRFAVVPYFETFWKRKVEAYHREFSTLDHLKDKGFKLIERTEVEKRIPVLFRVLSNHLTLQFSPDLEDFIDGK